MTTVSTNANMKQCYITSAIGVTSEGGHLLPSRGKDPNRGLLVFFHRGQFRGLASMGKEGCKVKCPQRELSVELDFAKIQQWSLEILATESNE